MRRESHVRFCEGGGVRLPSATRLPVCSPFPVGKEARGIGRSAEAFQVFFLRHENSPLARAFSCRRKRGSQLVRAPT